jgi:tetrapyrrole methylase family protein/MazG family protein
MVYLRTEQHPVVPQLPSGPRYLSFDSLYEEKEDFAEVYRAIAARLLELAGDGAHVVYAVPGDPTVGEASVTQLRDLAKDEGVSLCVIHGVSFVEPCLQALNADALDGLFIGDSLDVAYAHHPPFSPDRPALLGQVYSRLVAADLKLALMNQYPDDHPVSLIHAAGTKQVTLEDLPLHDIDHSSKLSALSALYIPPLPASSAFESFQETVAHLRAPDGCPWDREQTHQSLRPHLLEEAYEALAALDSGDLEALREELGDLLLQIVLHAQIATEEGTFRMADVIASIQEKIIHRHPHVFDASEVGDVDEVLHNWEAIKAVERERMGSEGGLLAGVPKGLPALAQALEIQSRVARVGFDWPDVEGVISKVQEELDEFFQAEDERARFDELGDLLFALVNFSRWHELDPESALREANRRFRERFYGVESRARRQGKNLQDMTLDELDELWKQAKGEGADERLPG